FAANAQYGADVIILAIALDYPVQFIHGTGLSRHLSLALVILVALVLLPILGYLLIPTLIQQIGTFINQLPQWVSSANGLFEWLNALPVTRALGLDFNYLEVQLTRELTGLIRALGSTLVSLLIGGFSGGLKVFFMIVLTVFMLTSGAQAWAGMMSWFSPWWRERLETRVPYKFRRFILGQMMLATGFAVVLGVIFTLLRVPLGLMFAFLIGMASLFPFMGAIAQTSISLFVMLHDLTIGLQVFLIALILGQILDEVILPKVMGGLVGVNPIWLLISVFIGARLGGVVGILIAVPVASLIKDIVDDVLAEPSGSPEPVTLETDVLRENSLDEEKLTNLESPS
ncbi:MAG: AI-2E family transporter, partial [Leptolyngbyaceae cyanobacterium SM2_5_2]|nr:AI-2E family transporter [Leptolyngbyaceae cyanobacterium SM2_5_2]